MPQASPDPRLPATPVASRQWTIVGGGLQGCHFATLLIQHYGYANVAIIDEQPRLLQRWLQRSAACRMKFMRSTSMHHLAPNPGDLLDFARLRGYGSEHFSEPYLRPSLTLFNAHCQEVLQSFRLAALHLRGRIYSLERSRDGWLLRYDRQDGSTAELQSENVILALGDQGECWGEFQPNGQTWHLSAPNFSLETVLAQVRKRREIDKRCEKELDNSMPDQAADICLVGGGISSAQLAIYLLEQGFTVQIHRRYALRSFQFDSEPGWLFKYLGDFQAEADLQKRWQIIVEERHKGTIPPRLYERLLEFERRGQLILKYPEDNAGHSDSAANLPAVLATGLHYETPSWLLTLARELGLPLLDTAAGPKPALRQSLEWDKQKAGGLYLAGRLGELFLGPAAGNIAGARVAARYLPLKIRHSASFSDK